MSLATNNQEGTIGDPLWIVDNNISAPSPPPRVRHHTLPHAPSFPFPLHWLPCCHEHGFGLFQILEVSLRRSSHQQADWRCAFASCGGGAKIGRYAARDGNDGDVWPNILEVDLKRPASATLRAIKSVRCTINDTLAPAVRGDFCGGLIVAANALFRR